MKAQRKRKIRSWRWLAESEEVISLCRDLANGAPGGIEIKRNAKRIVRHISAADGKPYFVKTEKLRPFAFLFRNKALRELSAAEWLEQIRIPCVHFVAYGEKHAWRPRTILVSEAVEKAVTAKEFWFSAAAKDPEKRALFLDRLASLLNAMKQKGVRHRDFHAGNILVSGDSCRLTLVDPVAVRRVAPDHVPAAELAHIAVDFLPEITDAESEKLLSVLSDRPAELLRELKLVLEKQIAKEWEKRRIQILSGNSKFSHTEHRAGRVFEIASTPWFAPGGFKAPETLFSRTLPADEARKIWLAFFRARLEGKTFRPDILMRERRGETEILYFNPEAGTAETERSARSEFSGTPDNPDTARPAP